MAENKDKKARGTKESPIVAFCIHEGSATTLITPYGEYLFAEWGLSKTSPVKDYAGRVKEELLRMAEQVKVGTGVYTDRDVRIQIRYGASPVKTR